jgi:hypothetical protein
VVFGAVCTVLGKVKSHLHVEQVTRISQDFHVGSGRKRD